MAKQNVSNREQRSCLRPKLFLKNYDYYRQSLISVNSQWTAQEILTLYCILMTRHFQPQFDSFTQTYTKTHHSRDFQDVRSYVWEMRTKAGFALENDHSPIAFTIISLK